MANFVAQERGQGAPAPPREPLDKWADGTAVNVYYHRSKTDTVLDICRPGFFNFMRDTFRSGSGKGVVHYIIAHLGALEDGLTEVRLHVLDAPPGVGDVTVAKGPVSRFTPVRHDGGAVDDDPKAKGKA